MVSEGAMRWPGERAAEEGSELAPMAATGWIDWRDL